MDGFRLAQDTACAVTAWKGPRSRSKPNPSVGTTSIRNRQEGALQLVLAGAVQAGSAEAAELIQDFGSPVLDGLSMYGTAPSPMAAPA